MDQEAPETEGTWATEVPVEEVLERPTIAAE